ncbi:MAG: pilus assembly protein [Chloroflexi bacterium]|nr:pilus assembly protein [Chloroflexota bacterium]
MAEFGLLLPVLLAFLGLTIDFARVYQAWITLESATRDAAEYAATAASSSSNATTIAKKTICLQSQDVPGFTRSGLASPDDLEQCTAPNVSVVTFTLSTTAPGASTRYPIGSATVQASLPFSPLIAWPFITQGGSWTIVTQATFSVVQGRE